MANKKFPKKTACELAHKLCKSNLFSNLYTYFNTVKKKKKERLLHTEDLTFTYFFHMNSGIYFVLVKIFKIYSSSHFRQSYKVQSLLLRALLKYAFQNLRQLRL